MFNQLKDCDLLQKRRLRLTPPPTTLTSIVNRPSPSHHLLPYLQRPPWQPKNALKPRTRHHGRSYKLGRPNNLAPDSPTPLPLLHRTPSNPQHHQNKRRSHLLQNYQGQRRHLLGCCHGHVSPGRLRRH